jgi:LmbE family N-acetylglucosaminyl deacetylase
LRIFAIFAHPDDESYGPAGTLAKASRDGHVVSLLTLTRGESGSLGVSRKLTARELAKRRCMELENAAGIIGIQNLHIRSLSDKSLKTLSLSEGTQLICDESETVKPDIVITYHENTISGHPDHLAVTRWVSNAINKVKPTPALFLYGLDTIQTMMVTFQHLIAVRQEEVTHRIDVEDYIDTKVSAICCHKTQISIWNQFLKSGIDFDRFARWEVFVQRCPVPESTEIKHDLF